MSQKWKRIKLRSAVSRGFRTSQAKRHSKGEEEESEISKKKKKNRLTSAREISSFPTGVPSGTEQSGKSYYKNSSLQLLLTSERLLAAVENLKAPTELEHGKERSAERWRGKLAGLWTQRQSSRP